MGGSRVVIGVKQNRSLKQVMGKATQRTEALPPECGGLMVSCGDPWRLSIWLVGSGGDVGGQESRVL